MLTLHFTIYDIVWEHSIWRPDTVKWEYTPELTDPDWNDRDTIETYISNYLMTEYGTKVTNFEWFVGWKD